MRPSCSRPVSTRFSWRGKRLRPARGSTLGVKPSTTATSRPRRSTTYRLVEIPPDLVGDGFGRLSDIAQLGCLVFDISLGELPSVVFAIPGREPDEAELVFRPFEDGIAVSIPTGGGRLSRRACAATRASCISPRTLRPTSFHPSPGLSTPRSMETGRSGSARYFSGWRICSVESGGLR